MIVKRRTQVELEGYIAVLKCMSKKRRLELAARLGGSWAARGPLGPSVLNRMLGTSSTTILAKTLGFREIRIDFQLGIPESLTTFLPQGKTIVAKYLFGKELAPRGGFEPPTFRLTAECSTVT